VPTWAQSSTPNNGNNTQALRIPNAKFVVLKSLGSFAERARLRATLAYYSCPASLGASASSGAPAVNFDLVLVGRRLSTGTLEVIQASEAKNDATEGFDITFPEAFDRIEMWAVGPDSNSPTWQACNGSKAEPYWWWAMWMPPP